MRDRVRRRPGAVPAGFVPTLLYLPLPFVLWATIRFGDEGASAVILVVTIVSVWRNLHGSTLLMAATPTERPRAAGLS